MGALYLGVCYPTAEAAKKAICSNAGQLVLGDGQMHASACTATDFSLATFDVVTSTDGVLNAIHTYQYPTFLDCEHTFTGELIYDWLAALLLVGASLWGLKQMYNLFSGRLDE